MPKATVNESSVILQVEDLGFAYSKINVLHELNMVVKRGEILALIGPNGSGKSTLLRCLNGFLHPNEGRVLLGDCDICHQTRRWISRHIAFLPQNLEAVHHITVWELVAMGRSPHNLFGWVMSEKDRQLIDWAIDYMSLRPLQNRWMEQISGGERQRVWIAMILAQDTDIVLLDEPITYLDLKYQWGLVHTIKQIRSKYGKTFVLVLHDINQAINTADRFIVLKDGCVRAQGCGCDIMTSHLLKDVYDVDAQVCRFNGHSLPVILPLENMTDMELPQSMADTY
jgi:ABC-type cobalamin/Fe3+-siderophores transport system ATPase subunit